MKRCRCRKVPAITLALLMVAGNALASPAGLPKTPGVRADDLPKSPEVLGDGTSRLRSALINYVLSRLLGTDTRAAAPGDKDWKVRLIVFDPPDVGAEVSISGRRDGGLAVLVKRQF